MDYRKAILDFLERNGERATSEIAKAIGLDNDRARYYLMRLVLEGKVSRRVASERVLLWRLKDVPE